MCALLVRRGLLAANPVDSPRVARVRPKTPAPFHFDYEEAETLLATIATPDTATTSRKPWALRDVALAAVLLTGGPRVAEACAVAVGDVRAKGVSPRLHLVGKGNKSRTLPLSAPTLEALQAYLAEREQRFGKPAPNDPLFVKHDGTPFTPRTMAHLVERWYTRAGIRPRARSCVHALRHTFATQLLDSGATVAEVQRLLGHASLETTQRYLDVVGSGLRDAVTAHPVTRMLERVKQEPDDQLAG